LSLNFLKHFPASLALEQNQQLSFSGVLNALILHWYFCLRSVAIILDIEISHVHAICASIGDLAFMIISLEGSNRFVFGFPYLPGSYIDFTLMRYGEKRNPIPQFYYRLIWLNCVISKSVILYKF